MKLLKFLGVASFSLVALGGCASGNSAFTLEVGTCFNVADLADVVSEVPKVECAEAHEAEVYEVFDVTGLTDYDAAAIDTQAQEGCLAAFEPFVGMDYDSSDLDVFYLTPSFESWGSAGDREVVCALVTVDGSTVTGTLKGSAR